MKFKRHFIYLFITLLSIPMTQATTPDWHESQASYRLRFSPVLRTPHQCFVPIPEELQKKVKSVKAYNKNGTAYSATPVIVNGKMVGVDVLISNAVPLTRVVKNSNQSLLPIHLYLYPTRTQSTNRIRNRQPIFVASWDLKLKTVPYTTNELLRLITIQKKPPVTSTSNAPRTAGKRDAKPAQHRGKKKGAPTYQICRNSTRIFIAEKSVISIRNKPSSQVWFACIDKKPFASWKDIDAGNVTLTPGAHLIDLYSINLKGRQVELPKIYYNSLPLERINPPLSSPLQPTAIIVDVVNSANSAGFAFNDINITKLRGSQEYLTSFIPEALGSSTLSSRLKSKLFSSGKLAISSCYGLPGVRVKSSRINWNFSAYLSPFQSKQSSATIQFSDLPILHSLKAPLQLELKANLEKNFIVNTSNEKIKLLIEQYLEKENIKQLHQYPKDNITIDSEATKLNCSLTFNKEQITSTKTISLINAKDFFKTKIELYSSAVYADDKPAILAYRTPKKLDLPKVNTTNYHLAILDDFWCNSNLNNSDLTIEEALQGFEVKKITTCKHDAYNDIHPKYRKFQQLHDLLKVQPDIVIFAIGYNDLLSKKKPEEFCRELIYCLEATCAAGSMPLLVTMPRFPQVDPKRHRLFSLYTKEIASSLKIPVIDLYSIEAIKLRKLGFKQFYISGQNSPNNHGRLWIAKQIIFNLKQQL